MFRLSLFVAGLWLICPMVRAGETPAHLERTVQGDAFARGGWEFQFAGGFAVSQNFHRLDRPQLNDADAQVRLGLMLNRPMGEGIWRGNFEVLIEAFGGAVVKGPGNGLAGTTLVLRRNMILEGWKLVPYYQIGGGGVYSDAHEERPQRILGSPLLFNLQAGFGARYFLRPRNAFFLEFDYRHISNAGMAERNAGLNSAVGWFGASFFF